MAFDFPQSKSRMFRVQFSGGSQEEALERCCNCVQTLAQYVTVQAPDSMVQQLQQSPGPLGAGESQGKDPLQQGVSAAVWLHKKPDDVMHGGDPVTSNTALGDPVCPPSLLIHIHTHK